MIASVRICECAAGWRSISRNVTADWHSNHVCMPSERMHDCQYLPAVTHNWASTSFAVMCTNYPSAGSPTETLLRLLLPLSDKVHKASTILIWISTMQYLNCLPDHSIGRSDGRCVQRAGTQSERADHPHILGIPRWRITISIINPHHDGRSVDCIIHSRQHTFLSECISVARVRPGTSKGITDLSLTRTSLHSASSVPLRNLQHGTDHVLLFSRARSRSLTKLTRQTTPPTKNGHAPPPIESWRNTTLLSILIMSGPGKFPRVESN